MHWIFMRRLENILELKMTPKFLEKVKKDYYNSNQKLDWESFLAGYIACLKRFCNQGK